MCTLTSQVDRIIFCVFLNVDYNIYSELLHHYFPPERSGAGEQEKEGEGEGEEGPPGEDDSKEIQAAATGDKEPAAAGEEKVPILQKSVTEPGKPTNRNVL